MPDYFNLKNGFKENPHPLEKFKNHVPKINSKLLVIIIVALVGLPITVILSRQEQDTRQFASEKKNEEKLAPKGYIVEFKSPPAAKTIRRGIGSQESRREFSNARSSIASEQKAAKTDILTRVGKRDFDKSKSSQGDKKVVLLSEFTNSFNGIAVDADSSEIDKIKSSPYVKAVYPNNAVKANLVDSVPLIGVPQVWEQVKDSNGDLVTGRGINIAILDSGTDYTHPDLGGSIIPERKFTKINSTPVRETLYYPRPQSFSIDGNRLAHAIENEKITILSLDTKNSQTIDVSTGLTNAAVYTIFLKDNNLFFTILYDKGQKLYYKNLDSGELVEVSNLNPDPADTSDYGGSSVVPYMNFYNGKLIIDLYNGNKDEFNRGLVSIYSWDVATQKMSKITEDEGLNPMNPRLSGNKLAYEVDTIVNGKFQPGKIYILDLDTNEKKLLNIQNSWRLEGFRENLILYREYLKDDKHHLYNIETGSDQLIDDSLAPSSNSINPLFSISLSSADEFIGDGAIFIKKGFSPQVYAYDLNLNKYFKINLKIPVSSLQVFGKKICFTTFIRYLDKHRESNIYCHDYDPESGYPLPSNVFNSKVVGGHNFIFNNQDPMDDFYHGTHVAGIAAGNGKLKGVAPSANIYAYKVLTSFGTGYYSTIISGIEKAIETRIDSDPANNINIINMSLGGYCGASYRDDCGPNDPLSQASNNAVDAGIVTVVAAGNSGSNKNTINTPGVAAKVITVGAINKSKNITSFSSRGPVIFNGIDYLKPDLVAPGEIVCSATLYGLGFTPSDPCFQGNYIRLSGTSMAAPHVAGLAALILQLHPDWTPEQVKDAIKNNVDDLGYDYDTQGAGLVNARKIFSIVSPTPTPIPTLTIVPTPTPTQIPTFTPTPTVALKKLTRNPSADSYVRSDQSSTNYGTATILQTDSTPNTITYMKYNLTPLAGKTIVSAKLILKVSRTSSISNSLRRAEDKSWTETGLKYSNRPSFLSVIKTFVPNKSVIELDVKSAVNLKKGGTLTLGVTSSGNAITRFHSRESSSSNRPQLVVEYR